MKIVDKYISNIKTIIERNVVSTKVRNLEEEVDRIITYWNVIREIDKAKYGNSFVKELSIELTRDYVKGYDYSNLRGMLKLYVCFSKLGTY